MGPKWDYIWDQNGTIYGPKWDYIWTKIEKKLRKGLSKRRKNKKNYENFFTIPYQGY